MANRVCASYGLGEPEGRLNPGGGAILPFAVVDHGDMYFTSTDPAWCRRVAAAWSEAADLLEAAQARAAGKDGA